MLNWLSRPPPAEPPEPMKPAETKSARAVVAWHAPGRPVWSARDHGAFAREGYAKNAVAHRCVRLIAEAAASAPLRVTPHDHPLAVLLALTGGVANPFIFLFVAPVAVSATVLRPAVTAGLAALCYVKGAHWSARTFAATRSSETRTSLARPSTVSCVMPMVTSPARLLVQLSPKL